LKRILLFIIILYSSSEAQTFLDSVNFFNTGNLSNILLTRFEKQLNTYYLNSGINYAGTYGRISLGLYENYHSTFIRTDDKNIRDEHSLLLNTGYQVDSAVNLKLSLSNIILSDNRKIEINQASVSSFLLLGRVTPVEKLAITPFAGYTNNRQKLENDYGSVYGIGGALDRLDFSDLSLSSELLFRNEDISPRKNFNRLFNVSALNSFSRDVANNLNLRFSESRKDFYYDADSLTSAAFNIKNNIQSRTERSYTLQDYLVYNNFLDMFSLDVTGRVLWRNIDRNTRYKLYVAPGAAVFDTDIDELRMEFESGLSILSDIHRSSLRVLVWQKDERHLTEMNPDAPVSQFEQRSEAEKRKNNVSTRASLLLASDINLSSKDKVILSLLHNKLRYDTPSDENFDDRDELLSIARIRYSRLLNPFFEFFTALEGTYSHIVYVFSEQSSNNYINRILKLNSGGSYRGKNFVSTNSFEVSANYTVYDFEDINPNYRSFSFRQFTASDSSLLSLGRNYLISFNGYLKYSEQGDLKWKSFSTRPNRYLEEFYAEPRLIYRMQVFNISAGFRFFSLKTYLYDNNVRKLNTRYFSAGPVTEVIMTINRRMNTRLYGWYEFITLEDKQKKEQINVNLEVEWNF